jgi:hemerythrin
MRSLYFIFRYYIDHHKCENIRLDFIEYFLKRSHKLVRRSMLKKQQQKRVDPQPEE